MISLSIVDYMHELKASGFTDKQAETQARKFEQIVTEVKNELKTELKEELQDKELIAKQDVLVLKSDLRETELRLQKEIEEVRKEIYQLELRINENINKAKLSTIMWVGIFFVSNGILMHFLK